jgi:hypothetical protein
MISLQENLQKVFRNIYIFESRQCWSGELQQYDLKKDLVLTFDFAIKSKIESMGGSVLYIDSIASENEMQKNNYLASDFFKAWHFDKYGNDIFTSQDIPFGFAFRIEIWSEFLHYVRLRANLEKLKLLNYQTIYLSERSNLISNILKDAAISFTVLPKTTGQNVAYFFDIHQYLYNAFHAFNWHNITRNILVNFFHSLATTLIFFFQKTKIYPLFTHKYTTLRKVWLIV